MTRVLALVYSLACYGAGVLALVYLILFVADLYVPVSMSAASPYSPHLSGASAAAWNIVLITIWGLQHSIMAAPSFKEVWTKVVPASVERSTYMLFVAVLTGAMMWLWVPMPRILWDLSGTGWGVAVLGVYFLGWVIVFFSTFLINHFQLFGLEQAYRFITKTQSKQDIFRTPLLYKLVRHPMMTGVLIALWAAPTLTVGRLLFNVAMTAYIWFGVLHEEKTLGAALGEEYEAYQNSTPMLIPGVKPRR